MSLILHSGDFMTLSCSLLFFSCTNSQWIEWSTSFFRGRGFGQFVLSEQYAAILFKQCVDGMFRLYVYFSCCHLIHFFLVELFSFRYMLSWYIMYILHWIFLNNKPGFKRLMLFVLKMLTGRDFLITGTSDCWLCFNTVCWYYLVFVRVWSIFIKTAGICPLQLQ